MHRFAPVALATLLAATAPALLCAQTATPFTPPQPSGRFTDPANLAGERVRPRDGRELPIDGGLAADGKPDNALALQQILRKLNTRASLMLIVAHPDDEDGGMLTYYSRGLGARVAVLTLTRGEGGQNAMTGDFEDALGLIRTQELLSADRYMGVDQFFGTEVDFGFSKTKSEAFAKWGHERVLYDAVRAVRIYRPLVIAAVFSGAVTDGHGQHQVSGQIAQEVFKAAGDPNVFPELTREGILPWQPLKVYARVPFSRVTDKGLYDYATGQTVPAEFTNYVTGQKFTTEPTADVTIHEGQPDPLLTYAATDSADLRKPSNPNEPLSYVQFARIGLGLQRSQVSRSDRVPPAGRVDVGYHLYGSRVCAPNLPNPTPALCHPEHSPQPEVEGPRQSESSYNHSSLLNQELAHDPSFFDGIDTSLQGIATLAPQGSPLLRAHLDRIATILSSASSHFDPEHPDKTAPALADAFVEIDRAIDSLDQLSASGEANENVRHELLVKRAQIDSALALALGVSMDATTSAADIDTGTAIKILSRIEEHSSIDLSVKDIHAQIGVIGRSNPAEEKRANMPLTNDHPDQRTVTVPTDETQTATRPYFFRNSIEEPVYQLAVPSLRNAPATPPAVIIWADLNYRGVTVTVGRVVHSGDQPVRFVPAIDLSLSARAQALPRGAPSLQTNAEVQASDDAAIRTKLLFSMPAGWTVKPSSTPLHSGTTPITIYPPPSAAQPATLSAVAHTVHNDHITDGYRAVGYGTLPRTNYYTPATLRIVPVDLKIPPPNKRRMAYLPGTGDDVPAALASIGLTPTILKVSDLTPDKLKAFDTVILGVRTYNAHPDLHGAPTQALFDFARSGGNVVVQYQTNEFSAADAPYPLTLRGERVIDETAPVKLLDLSSPLLTVPNRITSADFNGWIEERGHGFLDTWDPHYTALTETHDPGAPAEHIADQTPQRGGLITVQLGKGRWTYCAFALYRQLPEAVPGAFRLFANLLNP